MSGTDRSGERHSPPGGPGAPGGPDGPGAVREPDAASHQAVEPLLGAWALAVCTPEEAAHVDRHLGGCTTCAKEAVLLQEAVELLHPAENLDLDPGLRTRVLRAGLARRPAPVPVPDWAAPYDAETARLDALLADIGGAEWRAPVRLRWHEDDRPISRRTTVAAVIGHLMSVDGLVAVALGLDDPLGPGVPYGLDPVQRTETYRRLSTLPPTSAVRTLWREQSHRLVRTAARLAGGDPRPDGPRPPAHPGGPPVPVSAARRRPDLSGVAAAPVSYGAFALPLGDALVDRAFECWIHASDIAAAVDYPYGPPAACHLHRIIDLTARRLPGAAHARGRAGAPRYPGGPHAGPGPVLRLEVEGAGGGEWLIPLDRAPGDGERPDGGGGPSGARGGHGLPEGREVAHVALDGFEFCRLAAGHVSPEEATAGSTGDRDAVMAFLTATAALSRM